jgi:polyhydroxyalkanoate synthesis regulator phasin
MSDDIVDLGAITLEEARNALEDPVKGSLRVLKALGKQRDLYSAQLADGTTRLEAENALQQVAAEAAVEAYVAELREDGEEPPRITITRPRPLFK